MSAPKSEKPLRKDAAQNRDRLLEAAGRLLATDGPDVALERIAESAGVGIGTLYRNFPDRATLFEATHRNEIEQLCAAADELIAGDQPGQALASWGDLLIEFAPKKKGLVVALQNSGSSDSLPSREMLTAAIGRLLMAGIEAGELRDDLDTGDVVIALSAVWSTPDGEGWTDRARTVLGLLMDGLRYRPG